MKYRTLTAAAVAIALSAPAQAVDLACGAWLCSVVGFTLPGCSAVRVAMYKRVLPFPIETPIPTWGKCTKVDSSDAYANKPQGVSDQEWSDAIAISESVAGTETADVYSASEPRATLIYEKTRHPTRGEEWSKTPNLDRPPRIIRIKIDDLTADDLAPLVEGGAPWVGVAMLKGAETFKNGEQYGPTHWMNYNHNFFDQGDYNQNTITGEIERVRIELNQSSYLTTEQIVENARLDEEHRLEMLEESGVDAPAQTISPLIVPDEIVEPAVPALTNNQELIKTLEEAQREDPPEGMTVEDWVAALQEQIDALK